VGRDLKDSQAKDVSDDWRFAIAYNAALQAATAALAAAGHRESRENHHYRVIQSLELTLGKDAKFIRGFDAFRKKRECTPRPIGISPRIGCPISRTILFRVHDGVLEKVYVRAVTVEFSDFRYKAVPGRRSTCTRTSSESPILVLIE
jgi:hypothetical protein